MKEILKKIIRKIYYKLKININYKKSYSQCGEDLIIDYFLKVFNITKPSYLDIGAYHPTKMNNTFLFYGRGGKGVCIEPDPNLFAVFAKARKKDICLNIGIGTGEKEETDFYIMSSPTLNTLSYEEAKKFELLGNFKIKEKIKIKLKNINYIIEKYFNDTAPNFLSIDVEGIDFEILKSLNLNKYRPDTICIETISYSKDLSGEKNQAVINFMLEHNYLLYADTYINSIFVDQEALKKRQTNGSL